MKLTRRLVLSSLALALSPGLAFADTVKMSGSTTVMEALIEPYGQQIEKGADVSLDVVANGSSNGFNDLLEGRTDMAMISAPLDLMIDKMEAKQPGITSGADLHGATVMETRVAFIAHPSNPVKSLTLAQIADITSGNITNWADVGGPDLPIVLVAEPAGGGLRTLVETELQDKAPLSGDLRELPSAALIPGVVAQLPPALGIAARGPSEAAGLAPLQTDAEISQPLVLVTKGAPSGAAERVIQAASAIAH